MAIEHCFPTLSYKGDSTLQQRTIIGAVVRQERIKQNISTHTLCKELKLNKAYYCNFENGKQALSDKYMTLVSEFLDCQFNFDLCFYHEINELLDRIYVDYIEMNTDLYKSYQQQLLDLQAYYLYTTGHFVYWLSLAFVYAIDRNKGPKDYQMIIEQIEDYIPTLSHQQLIIFYLTKCFLLLDQNQHHDFLLTSQTGKELATLSHNQEAVALFNSIEGRYYSEHGLYKKAFYLFYEAYNYFLSTHHYFRMITVKINFALSLIGLQEYEKAESLLKELESQRLLPIEYKNSVIPSNLGWCYLQSNQLDQAQYYLQKALPHTQNDPFIYLNYALCLFKMEKYKECLSFMEDNPSKIPVIQSFFYLIGAIIHQDKDRIQTYGKKGLDLCDQDYDFDTKILLLELLIQFDQPNQTKHLKNYIHSLGFEFNYNKRSIHPL